MTCTTISKKTDNSSKTLLWQIKALNRHQRMCDMIDNVQCLLKLNLKAVLIFKKVSWDFAFCVSPSSWSWMQERVDIGHYLYCLSTQISYCLSLFLLQRLITISACLRAWRGTLTQSEWSPGEERHVSI